MAGVLAKMLVTCAFLLAALAMGRAYSAPGSSHRSYAPEPVGVSVLQLTCWFRISIRCAHGTNTKHVVPANVQTIQSSNVCLQPAFATRLLTANRVSSTWCKSTGYKA